MPAVTVDDLSKLPTIPVPDREAAAERPVRSVTTAPSGLEGEGFPGAAGLRRPQPGRPRPLRAHGPDGRGQLRAGEPKGTPGIPIGASRR